MTDENMILDDSIQEYDMIEMIENDKLADVVIQTIDVVEVEDTKLYTVGTQSAFSALGEPNEQLIHSKLTGRGDEDQHPIEAIRGLRAELDGIEALQTLYSDKVNHANYYKWADGNPDGELRLGLFVTADNQAYGHIKVCSDTDEVGVTVSDAAFIGNQDDVQRDYTYGLVAHSGIVAVRCEPDVEVGDYVIPNRYGVAQATHSDYGYKVSLFETIQGISYAVIDLKVSVDKIYKLGKNVEGLDVRIAKAEQNIVSAINVANEAYNKADKIDDVSTEAVKNALKELGVDGMVSEFGGFKDSLTSTSTLAATAKVTADNALSQAIYIRKTAVDTANQAMTKVEDEIEQLNKVKTDMEDILEESVSELQSTKETMAQTVNELQGNVDQVVSDMEALEGELEPLVAWPKGSENPTGIAGFVAQANENGVVLGELVTWKDGDGDESLAGFVREVTKDNATVSAIANYQQKDADGNVIGEGASALLLQVNANTQSIDLLTKVEGDGYNGLAGLTAQVNQNASSVKTLASHVVGDYDTVDDWVEEGKDIDKVYYDKSDRRYYYYNGTKWIGTTKPYEAGLTGTLSGIQQTADDNAANIEMITSFEGEFGESLAGLVSTTTEENAEIKALAEYGYTDENGYHGGAVGIMEEVDKNKATLRAVANYIGTDEYGQTFEGLAGLKAQVDGNKSNVEILSNHVKGNYVVITELPNNEEDRDINKFYYSYDANGQVCHYGYDYGQSAWLPYSWSEIANKLDTSLIYYDAGLKKYWYYDKEWISTEDAYTAGLPSAIAGIQVVTDDNSSKINQIASWRGDTKSTMAEIEVKADENGASITNIVSNIDIYSVGEYSQSYGLSIDQAKGILKKGMVYIPTVNHAESYDKNVTFSHQSNYRYSFSIDGVDYTDMIANVDEFGDAYIGNLYLMDANETNTQDKYLIHIIGSGIFLFTSTAGNHQFSLSYSTLNESKPIVLIPDGEYTLTPHKHIGVATPHYYWDNVVHLQKTEISFTRQNCYIWNGQGWDENGTGCVAFSKYPPEQLGNLLYWYTETNDVATGYEAYTLYMWENKTWKRVNILDGNVTNRIVSMIRQNADSITAEVVNARGDAASLRLKINEIESSIDQVASHIGTTTGVNNVAAIRQTATDGSSSIVLGVYQEGQNGESGNYEVLQGTNITLHQDGKNSYISLGGWIVEGSRFSRSTAKYDVILNAPQSDENGVLVVYDKDNGKYPFSVLADGTLTATKGTIAGWDITQNSIWSSYNASKKGSFYIDSTSNGNYWLRAYDGINGTGNMTFGVYKTGRFIATAGKIADWEINSGYLGVRDDLSTSNFFLSRTGIKLWVDAADKEVECLLDLGGNFAVDTNGKLYAKGAEISGTIHADYGSFSRDVTIGGRSIANWITDTGYINNIEATSGSVGGIDILSNSLHIGGRSLFNNNTLENKYGVFIGQQSLSGTGYDGGISLGTYSGNTYYEQFLYAGRHVILGKAGNAFYKTVTTASQLAFYYSADKVNVSDSDMTNVATIQARTDGASLLGSWFVGGGSTAVTSDINKKNTITLVHDKYEYFFDNLIPKTYKYNDGTSDRLHTGFIAQEVKAAMDVAQVDTSEFAGLVISNNSDGTQDWFLRYDEFISLNTWQIQKLKARVNTLEQEIEKLKSRLEI